MMTSKTTYTLTIVTIAIAATMLAISPMANQVLAQDFPGSGGQGHQRDTNCTQGGRDLGDECPGKSEEHNKNRDECTTVFAGKSDTIKFTNCPPE
jgi:hypothetical protein